MRKEPTRLSLKEKLDLIEDQGGLDNATGLALIAHAMESLADAIRSLSTSQDKKGMK